MNRKYFRLGKDEKDHYIVIDGSSWLDESIADVCADSIRKIGYQVDEISEREYLSKSIGIIFENLPRLPKELLEEDRR